ncbi:MAG: sulfur carrier protein ThiS [Bacteroidia bacterium]|nr:sulfur carrier protein ThiS [Bacteroidia bacterium]MDW8134209.1 sulfur carrier protein ThiS [Bacteroidia bacterium]
MHIQLNGEKISIAEGTTIVELLKHIGLDAAQVGIAIALNRQVIRREEWSSLRLKEGDQVELVYARQGG